MNYLSMKNINYIKFNMENISCWWGWGDKNGFRHFQLQIYQVFKQFNYKDQPVVLLKHVERIPLMSKIQDQEPR